MSDWRNNPRQGKSRFMPLLDEVNKQIALGETVKQIYDAFTDQGIIEMSYPQFTRYVKRYCIGAEQTKPVVIAARTREPVKTETDTQAENEVSDSKLSSYMKVCFRNERIARRAIEKNISIETIESWKAPNQTRLSNLISSYTDN